jgi:hypothetical protein
MNCAETQLKLSREAKTKEEKDAIIDACLTDEQNELGFYEDGRIKAIRFRDESILWFGAGPYTLASTNWREP